MELRPRRLINIMLKFSQTLPTSDHHASSLLPIEMKTLYRNGNCFQYLILFRPRPLAWIIYPRGSSASEPQSSANHSLTCSINLCPHLQFHFSGNMLSYSRCQRRLPPSSIVTFGQYLLPLSSVGHLNVLSSSSFYILPFSPLLPLFLSQTNSHFVPQGPPLLRS